MARLPDETVERIRREISVQRLAEARGIQLRRMGKNMMGLCPFHQDKNPSLSITPSTNKWHCLGCGKGGTAIDWVMHTEGVSTRHALEMLSRDLVPMTPASAGPPPKKCTVPKLPPLIQQTNDDKKLVEIVVSYYHKTLKEKPEAQQYLVKRGLKSAEMVEHFRLGYSNRTLGYHLPESNRLAGAEQRGRLTELGIYRESGHEHFSGSLVIPILNLNGEVVQMYGRKITPNLRAGTPDHLYLPGPLRGVWNEQALIASKEIILCEALIDALTFWCAGYRNVTTIYGVNNFTDELRAALKQHGTKRIYIAYDRDDAGAARGPGPRRRTHADGHRVFPGAVSERPGRERIRSHDATRSQSAGRDVDQRRMVRHRKAVRRERHQACCDRSARDRGGENQTRSSGTKQPGGGQRTRERRNPSSYHHSSG